VAGQRRRWGWHQLHPEAAERLVAGARLPARALVLDVGAGTGAITQPLVDAGHRVIAVEAHPGRAAELRERFGNRITVVRADAADLRLPRRPFHVVANPPFGITSALLRRLLHPGSRMASATVVLEERAVRRWTGPAAPAGQRWAPVFEVVAGPPVQRRCFTPRPAVDARLLLIRRR
jgi:23S rRNA (adenine-N6)-dimethyltransferase